MRVDKWLWVARLVKTRALAAEAVSGGRVAVNGRRVKPSKDVRPGDVVEITLGEVRLEVVIRAEGQRRGPTAEAAGLYEESERSREARKRHAAERRLAASPGAERGGRPTKRDRRRFERGRR